MSIYGNQQILPMFLRENKNLAPINEAEELSIAFYLLTNDIGEGEKIISFSRLLWPFICVPGVISTHIILDGLFLLNRKGKLTNPPRQPLIGHFLRNIDNLSVIEQLNKLIDILTYADIGAESIGKGEETEYKKLKIKSLVNLEFLQALLKLIPGVQNKPVSDYMPLDSGLLTDEALDISEKYRNSVETIRGNALRWRTQIELIRKEFDKILIDLNVKIKDVHQLYASKINKVSSMIDNYQIKEATELESDKVEQWKTIEKKKLRESIILLFKNLSRQLDDIIKRNRFYSLDDSLKKKSVEEILPTFNNHFTYLKEETKNLVNSVNEYYQKFQELIAKIPQVDQMAVENLYEYERTLNIKLQDRDKLLSEYKKEEQEKTNEIEAVKTQIEGSLAKIMEIIKKKISRCLQEAEELKRWSLEDKTSEFFSIPIQWIYLPLYAMFIEDEDMMEERLDIVLPGHVYENNFYAPISEAFLSLKTLLNDKIEDDIVIRSNFEFSCEKKNFLDDPNLKSTIQRGISSLREKSLMNEEIEKKILVNLNLLS